jgi:mRNA-degrading endonuclease RelE of RelBE toxin-antitoxin system
MPFEVEALSPFLRDLKRLSKKYRSLVDDVERLGEGLKNDPYLGTPLGGNCYKVRLAISSKGKGKSGGARVITFVHVVGRKVYLLDIYDKSESDSLSPEGLKALLSWVPR